MVRTTISFGTNGDDSSSSGGDDDDQGAMRTIRDV